ncbi:hypothetical protein RHSIM_Rhsim10G0041800 [Rhododendron simsii]|uniref:Uncharacterized protein n=1 Tax=Rhododendron simsii TaxID=118357 RepID=A0A834LA28_RHOSS|nr:hypothetical protein RHSIM_Rhsim10G0041800 [Rhododendron simsii]
MSPPRKNMMITDVLDARLLPPTNPIVAGNIVLVATMAFACLHPQPKSRPSMLRLSQEFLSRQKALAAPLHTALVVMTIGTEHLSSLPLICEVNAQIMHVLTSFDSCMKRCKDSCSLILALLGCSTFGGDTKANEFKFKQMVAEPLVMSDEFKQMIISSAAGEQWPEYENP